MPKSEPFLGTTLDRSGAFSDYETIAITITQDPWAEFCPRKWERTSKFTKSDMPRYLPCANRRCRQGGLDLQKIVEFHLDGEHEYACDGHEGTPAGSRIGDPCSNVFKISLAVVRKVQDD